MEIVDKKLLQYFNESDYKYGEVLFESITYSVKAGGKRIRPLLVLEFAKLLGVNEDIAIDFACAIEMIHTYSLIHDDLPCMDNDDLRRGKPTNHKVFGEDIALLSGDALLTKAFEIILCEDAVKKVGADTAIKCASVLSKFAGEMVKGQCIDLKTQGEKRDVEVLKAMYMGKTAALIKASCVMGALCAKGSDEELAWAESYAENLGLAFQIRDDMLDIIGDSKVMGKNTGNDLQNEKCNFMSILGFEECERLVEKYSKQAINELSKFKGDTTSLEKLTISLIDRIK